MASAILMVAPPGAPPTAGVLTVAGPASSALVAATGLSIAAPYPFFAGRRVTFGSLGYRTQSMNGQGFHAVGRNYAGTVSSAFSGLNAIFRVSGNIVIPVELLEFEVD